jgi:hypothetical protein
MYVFGTKNWGPIIILAYREILDVDNNLLYWHFLESVP